MEKIESRRRSFVCFLLFILLLPSVSPLSMSEPPFPRALVRIPVGKSVFAGALLQVGHILSFVFAPCAELQKCICRISKVYLSAMSFRSLIRMAKVALIVSLPPVLLLRYLPLPSLSPATQSPSYLITCAGGEVDYILMEMMVDEPFHDTPTTSYLSPFCHFITP